MNVVITGANRGIGLEFVRHYLAQGCEVWAGYRRDEGGLDELHGDALHLFRIDVAHDVDRITGQLPERIDLLINNAGIYGPKKGGQSLDDVTPEAMLEVFNVDCVGPLRVVQSLKQRVIDAKGVIANVSSKMGSSGDNTSGGTYAYRAAKAALVIVSKSMAVDLASYGVRVITLHPGWVKTDMTGRTGLIDAPASVAGMTDVIAHADDYDPGSFIAFDGKVVPY
ncbi:MAG TPA: SDR family oxidoreductase [Mariprofundaceae bacterium]|nr:SDR family oxidoreductase [Mariprofundaceae bacterium]